MQTAPPTFLHIAALRAFAGALAALTGFGLLAPLNAEDTPAPPEMVEASSTRPESGFDVLPGRWVRPDGGYTVTIKSVRADGKLDAAYANPNPLPFSKAEASLDGETIKVLLELTAGGYNGSTYTLTYDTKKDILKGVYYQAVAKQEFEIFFVRVR